MSSGGDGWDERGYAQKRVEREVEGKRPQVLGHIMRNRRRVVGRTIYCSWTKYCSRKCSQKKLLERFFISCYRFRLQFSPLAKVRTYRTVFKRPPQNIPHTCFFFLLSSLHPPSIDQILSAASFSCGEVKDNAAGGEGEKNRRAVSTRGNPYFQPPLARPSFPPSEVRCFGRAVEGVERRRGKQRMYGIASVDSFSRVPLTSFPQPPSLFIVPKSMDRNRKICGEGAIAKMIMYRVFRHSYPTRKTFVRFRCQTFPVVVSKGDVRVRSTSRRANEKRNSLRPLCTSVCVSVFLFFAPVRVTIKKRERETVRDPCCCYYYDALVFELFWETPRSSSIVPLGVQVVRGWFAVVP